jgi:hypothetical protein
VVYLPQDAAQNKANMNGHILDPTHPQELVYAITDGRATLLGALFQMSPRTG